MLDAHRRRQAPRLLVTDRYSRVFLSMRFIYLAPAVGMAIVVLFIAPVVLMGVSSAHADTGVNGYLHCIKSDAAPPPPGVHAGDWFPIVKFVEERLDSGESPAQVADKLAGMGVKPDDAVTQVQCVLANEPH